ncbi:MAG: signal recognition particle-docking protein FtsY [Armatimonadota bacterium]|nr:signal recognition particle-docking protein FtsY [Armatimonadota bacterium]MDR7443101.1 signal recognition particle-docking protein FtsY [Armatimonadota bacterium]MDR7569627.1 signal recognition particle-docking protein FtsY [Armatimonadota bacterium]MDR7614681.1 signal recognition particle-docking protein FtsY [Armatimonadota bacterium]
METRVGFLQRLRDGLRRTRQALAEHLESLLTGPPDERFFEGLEEALLRADVGPDLAEEITREVRRQALAGLHRPQDLRRALRAILLDQLGEPEPLRLEPPPAVVLVLGVNGSGKTTTVGKLAHHLVREGRRVLVAAADTFRAAAIDQLETWTQRAGVPLVRHREGSDPAAVVFDALQALRARPYDVLLVDTAGRLHTKVNLMEELRKIRRMVDRHLPEGTVEALLVLDATTGQNALAQAHLFREAVGVSGIALAKLDSSAKGGVVLAIRRELGIPVKLVGTGERMEDLSPFDPEAFVEALLPEA